MRELDFLEHIEAVCKRPNLYTPQGTVNEVISYLEGFGTARSVDRYGHHLVFTAFRIWVKEKFYFDKRPISWKEFRELFSSDLEVLEQLPILYKEYIESLD